MLLRGVQYNKISEFQSNFVFRGIDFGKIALLVNSQKSQRYTYRVLQTIQMKLILLCVSAEQAVLGSAKTALPLEK